MGHATLEPYLIWHVKYEFDPDDIKNDPDDVEAEA